MVAATLTGAGVVDMVITDLGVFNIDRKGGGGMTLVELAPGISLDEMLAGHKQGKDILYFPADMNHELATRQAEQRGLPPPQSFKGAAHDTFIGKKSAMKTGQNEAKSK